MLGIVQLTLLILILILMNPNVMEVGDHGHGGISGRAEHGGVIGRAADGGKDGVYYYIQI